MHNLENDTNRPQLDFLALIIQRIDQEHSIICQRPLIHDNKRRMINVRRAKTQLSEQSVAFCWCFSLEGGVWLCDQLVVFVFHGPGLGLFRVDFREVVDEDEVA